MAATGSSRSARAGTTRAETNSPLRGTGRPSADATSGSLSWWPSLSRDSLGPKCGACTAVAAGTFHEVILLGDRGYLGAPYYPVLHGAEELIGSCLTMLRAAPGLRAEDALADPGVHVQEKVLGEASVAGPQRRHVGPAGSAELAFRVSVAPVAKVLLADPD